MADKHIRLNSKLSLVAAFWKPDTPDEVTTGSLTGDDDGIHFVTSPQYAKGTDTVPPAGAISDTVIHSGSFSPSN
jgi:hypothetical protein